MANNVGNVKGKEGAMGRKRGRKLGSLAHLARTGNLYYTVVAVVLSHRAVARRKLRHCLSGWFHTSPRTRQFWRSRVPVRFWHASGNREESARVCEGRGGVFVGRAGIRGNADQLANPVGAPEPECCARSDVALRGLQRAIDQETGEDARGSESKIAACGLISRRAWLPRGSGGSRERFVASEKDNIGQPVPGQQQMDKG